MERVTAFPANGFRPVLMISPADPLKALFLHGQGAHALKVRLRPPCAGLWSGSQVRAKVGEDLVAVLPVRVRLAPSRLLGFNRGFV